ncbi:MAG: hypothetical protein ACJ757_07940 [Gaiellaceae bacterium]
MVDWIDAINTRRFVSFAYDGYERVVVPAAYGRNENTGNYLIRAYQTGGRDATRAIPAWSIFRADKVVNPRVLDEHFAEDPPGYQRNDSAMDIVYAQL